MASSTKVQAGWWKWKFTPLKGVLLTLFGISVAVAIWRLFAGLGAVTNLSDSQPWGIWKAFDVIIVIPLGACGFTMAFVRYFFKANSYEHIARRAVIWAAICYLSAGLRLAFDIGLPWRLPNPLLFSRNIHSALLEVAWCMALYLIVLFMENIPRVLERFEIPWVMKLDHWVHKAIPAFVLGGVLLSSMHQSTLGTLYMITGKRMDPLFYHPWLNYMFLLTAIAAGLAVTICIEGWSNYYYKTPFQTNLLARLGAAIGVALGIAFVWRFWALAAEGNLGMIFEPRFATLAFWVEIFVLYLVPLSVLVSPKLRNNRKTLLIAAFATVGGMMIMRLNVVFTGMWDALGMNYTPKLPELLFTIGATAGTLVIYTWFVETLPSYLGQDANTHAESAAD